LPPVIFTSVLPFGLGAFGLGAFELWSVWSLARGRTQRLPDHGPEKARARKLHMAQRTMLSFWYSQGGMPGRGRRALIRRGWDVGRLL